MAKEQSVKTQNSSKRPTRSPSAKKKSKLLPDAIGIKANQPKPALKKRVARKRSKVSDNPKSDERRMALRHAIAELSSGHDDRLYELISRACKEGELLRKVGPAWRDFIDRSNWKHPRMAPRQDASRDATFHLLKWLFQDVQDGNKTASLYWRAVQHIAENEPEIIYNELKKHGVRKLAQMNVKARRSTKQSSKSETGLQRRVKLGEIWAENVRADCLGDEKNAKFEFLVTRQCSKPVAIYIVHEAKEL